MESLFIDSKQMFKGLSKNLVNFHRYKILAFAFSYSHQNNVDNFNKLSITLMLASRIMLDETSIK